MSINEFISNNFAALMGFIFLLVVLVTNHAMSKRQKCLFYMILGIELVELIAYNLELYTASLAYPTKMRILLSAIGYSARPLILYLFIKMSQEKPFSKVKEHLLLIPEFIAVLAAFSAFFSDICYFYDTTNRFHRGPFGYVSQTMSVIYMVIFMYEVIRYHILKKKTGSYIMVLIMIYNGLAMVLEAVFNVRSVGRVSIVYSTVFFLFVLEITLLEKSARTEEENEKLKETLEELERARHEILLNQSEAQVLGGYYLSVLYADLNQNSIQVRKTEKGYEELIFQIGIDKEGYQYDDAICNYAEKIVVPQEQQIFKEQLERHRLMSYLKNNPCFIARFNCRDKEQNVFCVEANIVAIDEGKNPGCVVIGLRNVEEMVRKEKMQMAAMEAAMKEAQRANAAKSEFLSRISHDMRTPLNGVIGMIEINDRHPEDIELMKHNRAKAKIAADHLLRLINDLLDMSKLEDENTQWEQEAFNIQKLAGETITLGAMQAADAGIAMDEISCDDQFQYPYVYGYPLHVRQIFLNIIGNAIKYNKPGGKIMCKVHIVSHDDCTVWYRATISDTGIGISPEYMKQIFEPFTQEHGGARSNYMGTGLGMSIVKKLVDHMGGTIKVTSEVNVGSTFEVEIPFKIAREEDLPKEEQTVVKRDLSGMKILLVEDNELNMEIAKTVLEDMGVDVDCAEDGKQAVEVFANSPVGNYQAILMDIMMPVMNGYEASREIRHLNRKDAGLIPIIALTANAFSDDIKKCREAGMNDHIAKPIEIERLKEVLSKY